MPASHLRIEVSIGAQRLRLFEGHRLIGEWPCSTSKFGIGYVEGSNKTPLGAFVVREKAKRTALNPKTGEKVTVKAGATVRFKASPALKEAAFAGLKKAKRKAAKS